MSWAIYLLVIVSGLLNPVQSALTGALEKALKRPFTVAAISLGLSLVCAIAGALYQGEFTSLGSSVGKAPWWAWLAGFSGFVVLIARPIAGPPTRSHDLHRHHDHSGRRCLAPVRSVR